MQLRDWTVRLTDSSAVRTTVAALPRRALPVWERTRPRSTRRLHIDRVVQHRTGANGVFGLKLQPDQLARWFGDLDGVERHFGPLHLIRLRRTDRSAQVDSFVHALRTGQWSATDSPSRVRLPVSRRWAETHIQRQEDALDHVTTGRAVHTLTTEALLADFDGSLRSVLRHLDVSTTGPLPGRSQRRQRRP